MAVQLSGIDWPTQFASVTRFTDVGSLRGNQVATFEQRNQQLLGCSPTVAVQLSGIDCPTQVASVINIGGICGSDLAAREQM